MVKFIESATLGSLDKNGLHVVLAESYAMERLVWYSSQQLVIPISPEFRRTSN